jgi:hypothetical protein
MGLLCHLSVVLHSTHLERALAASVKAPQHTTSQTYQHALQKGSCYSYSTKHGNGRESSVVQAKCRTHRPQKLECLISLCTNPVSILSVPIQTVR